MRLVALQVDDQALDLLRQLVGTAPRSLTAARRCGSHFFGRGYVGKLPKRKLDRTSTSNAMQALITSRRSSPSTGRPATMNGCQGLPVDIPRATSVKQFERRRRSADSFATSRTRWRRSATCAVRGGVEGHGGSILGHLEIKAAAVSDWRGDHGTRTRNPRTSAPLE
jgi:hypothetical protein